MSIIDLLKEMRPEAVAVQLPPDLPMFIRTTSSSSFDKVKGDDYVTSWRNFLKRGRNSSFYVNPNP